MKSLLFVTILLPLFLCSCKKTVEGVVNGIIGSYTTIRVCETDSAGIAVQLDTLQNIGVTVTKGSSSSIIINSITLDFVGDLSEKRYEFAAGYGAAGSYYASIDAAFHIFKYSEYHGTHSPGRYGTECIYSGAK